MESENKKRSNPSAFPNTWTNENGMTLRDYFANSAMQGLMTEYFSKLRNNIYYDDVDNIAKKSYELADAMLKQREL